MHAFNAALVIWYRRSSLSALLDNLQAFDLIDLDKVGFTNPTLQSRRGNPMPRPARLQAAILDALEPAKQTHRSGELVYLGGAFEHNWWAGSGIDSPDHNPEVHSKGQYFTLDAGVYDMRATLLYAAQRWADNLVRLNERSGYQQVNDVFRTQFIKAVKGLVAKGKLHEAAINRGGQLRFVCLDPALSKQVPICAGCGEQIHDAVGAMTVDGQHPQALRDKSGGYYFPFHDNDETCYQQAARKRDSVA
jgi:hypothetical protein